MARPAYEADRFRVVLRDWPERRRAQSLAGGLGPLGRRASPGRPTAGRSTPPPTTSASTRSSRSTSRRGKVDARSSSDGHVAAPQLAGDARRLPGRDHSARAGGALLVRRGRQRRAAPHRASTTSALARDAFGEPEQFTFKGANGETVYGWVVKPVDFDPAKKYPVAFLDPRRAAGLVRQRLPLPLEPAGLRRRAATRW